MNREQTAQHQQIELLGIISPSHFGRSGYGHCRAFSHTLVTQRQDCTLAVEYQCKI